jgi:hypothetical protein
MGETGPESLTGDRARRGGRELDLVVAAVGKDGEVSTLRSASPPPFGAAQGARGRPIAGGRDAHFLARLASCWRGAALGGGDMQIVVGSVRERGASTTGCCRRVRVGRCRDRSSCRRRRRRRRGVGRRHDGRRQGDSRGKGLLQGQAAMAGRACVRAACSCEGEDGGVVRRGREGKQARGRTSSEPGKRDRGPLVGTLVRLIPLHRKAGRPPPSALRFSTTTLPPDHDCRPTTLVERKARDLALDPLSDW